MFRISVWVCVGILMVSCALPMAAQSWSALNNKASFNASTALLLTDGTVLVQQIQAGAWWRLTPDNTGSYVNGTWTSIASMPSTRLGPSAVRRNPIGCTEARPARSMRIRL